jgi:hypothetical protein
MYSFPDPPSPCFFTVFQLFDQLVLFYNNNSQARAGWEPCMPKLGSRLEQIYFNTVSKGFFIEYLLGSVSDSDKRLNFSTKENCYNGDFTLRMLWQYFMSLGIRVPVSLPVLLMPSEEQMNNIILGWVEEHQVLNEINCMVEIRLEMDFPNRASFCRFL